MGQRKRRDLSRDAIGCSTCGALVKELCRTKRGSSTIKVHASRFYAATVVLCTCPKG